MVSASGFLRQRPSLGFLGVAVTPAFSSRRLLPRHGVLNAGKNASAVITHGYALRQIHPVHHDGRGCCRSFGHACRIAGRFAGNQPAPSRPGLGLTARLLTLPAKSINPIMIIVRTRRRHGRGVVGGGSILQAQPRMAQIPRSCAAASDCSRAAAPACCQRHCREHARSAAARHRITRRASHRPHTWCAAATHDVSPSLPICRPSLLDKAALRILLPCG